MGRASIHMGRALAVWAAVTASAVASAAAMPAAWGAARVAAGPDAVVDLLVAACASGLAIALAWVWVVTSLTVAALLAGKSRGGDGTTRRLVLVACGAAVLAGTGVPALAAGGDGAEHLVGLALPDRAVAPTRTTAERRPPPRTVGAEPYVVRPGDSLWSIAQQHPVDAGSTEARWRAIWRANRAVVGDDPDLIHPGQALSLPERPTPPSHAQPDQDGDPT
jgi:nucleoid-associated protein YgaU